MIYIPLALTVELDSPNQYDQLNQAEYLLVSSESPVVVGLYKQVVASVITANGAEYSNDYVPIFSIAFSGGAHVIKKTKDQFVSVQADSTVFITPIQRPIGG
jgi:hypothetical protein